MALDTVARMSTTSPSKVHTSMLKGRAQVSCPYCGGKAVRSLSGSDINRGVTDVVFHQFRCTKCRLRFIANPPDNLPEYYGSEYNYPWTTLENLDRIGAPLERYKIDLVLAAKKSGKLLEIGASDGVFCRLAQQAGFDVHAIEMNQACVNFMNDTMGIRAVQSDDPVAVLEVSDERYDAICLWHTIEHLPEPWRMFELAASSLAPDGVLVIATPNPDAWQARLLRARWPHHDLPRHLYLLPIAWIRDLARKSGLAVDDITTRDEGSLFWNKFTWATTLRSWGKDARGKTKLWNAGLSLGRMLNPLEGREGAGAAYTAILRRPH
ncbi:MAG: class I SAM-dependent methyltransferase [Alphaproteobacteria bacterium]|nr:class I SAM-dependent methyltransferase [Alphaproteobacteria bacterium]